ncbi:hypothetical protein HYX01_05095 [Candidatus Woesearchaeota archaeon]|nr:hypothetical protein [Candidatus Woesearchaeota archaeon]
MNGSQLNKSGFKYKEFCGKTVDKMPQLIGEGRMPLSVAGLMEIRLETQNAPAEVRDYWRDNFFDTGDGIAYHPNGRIKIVADAIPLREMNSGSRLVDGTLVLPHDIYKSLEGMEFTREAIERYFSDGYTREGAKLNPLWKILARDQHLLNEYVDLTFAEAKLQFQYDTNMGIYIKDAPKNFSMRLWCIGMLRSGYAAFGGGGLAFSGGRIIGILPEVQHQNPVVAPTLEQILTYSKSPIIAPANGVAQVY